VQGTEEKKTTARENSSRTVPALPEKKDGTLGAPEQARDAAADGGAGRVAGDCGVGGATTALG